MAANLLGRNRDAEVTARVKGFLRDTLRLSHDSTVMVTELRCTEPGCPPLETVLAVLVEGSPRQRKIHKPLAEVTEADVQRAWRGEAAHARESDESAKERRSEDST